MRLISIYITESKKGYYGYDLNLRIKNCIQITKSKLIQNYL